MEKNKVDFDSLPWQNSIKGCRFKSFQQGSRKLRLVEFSRQFVEPDWCTRGHIGYVLEGKGQVDFNSNIVHFSPGEGVFIPAGIENKHKTSAITDAFKVILVEDV